MKCDNIKLCKINILVSTFRTFDNRDKALICLPALLHNNAMLQTQHYGNNPNPSRKNPKHFRKHLHPSQKI